MTYGSCYCTLGCTEKKKKKLIVQLFNESIYSSSKKLLLLDDQVVIQGQHFSTSSCCRKHREDQVLLICIPCFRKETFSWQGEKFQRLILMLKLEVELLIGIVPGTELMYSLVQSPVACDHSLSFSVLQLCPFKIGQNMLAKAQSILFF